MPSVTQLSRSAVEVVVVVVVTKDPVGVGVSSFVLPPDFIKANASLIFAYFPPRQWKSCAEVEKMLTPSPAFFFLRPLSCELPTVIEV